MLRSVLLVLGALLVAFPTCNTLVIGIDLGSRFFKVGLLQPGKPYQIIMNIESKRKTSTAVTLGGAERLFGNTAQGSASRRPLNTILLATTLLGRTEDEAALHWVKESLLPDSWFVDPVRKTYRFMLDDGETSHSVEEVVAMILQEAQAIASAAAGVTIKDAVVSVPPFYTQQQRMALMDAARISGLSVTGLINDNTAVALAYGVEKDKQFRDAEDPRVVVFFDMGFTSTRASVVRFHNTPSKLEKKTNKTVGEYVVKGVSWDEELGALSFDNIIMEKVATGFNAKRKVADGSDKDVRKFPKAVGKMRKAAEKAKEVLSTIPETAVTIEGLLDDTDYVMPISRKEMEEMAAPLLERVMAPVERALEQSGYTKEDIHSVEIVGGGSRIPCVQERLKAGLGKDLGVSLNGDDAVGLGATLYAAKESTSHRMRETVLKDGNPYAMDVRVVPLDPESTDTAEISREVFAELCRQPVNKRLSFSRTGNFEVFMDYSPKAKMPAGTSRAISKFTVTGIEEALENYADQIVVEEVQAEDEEAEGEAEADGEKDDSAAEEVKKSKASLSMQLTKMGTVELFRYDATINLKVTPTPTPEPTPIPEDKEDDEDDVDDGEEGAAPADDKEDASTDDKEDAAADDKEDAAADDKEDAPADDKEDAPADEKEDAPADEKEDAPAGEDGSAGEDEVEEEDKVLTRVKHIKLNVTFLEREDSLLGLNTTDLADSIELLQELNNIDRKRRELEAAKNDLETHVYSVRDFFYEAEDIEKVCTEEQKEKIMEEMTKAEDWIYEDGADVDLDTYLAKLEEVKEISAPVRFRYTEMTDRPATIGKARERVDYMVDKLDAWNASKPWIPLEDREKLVNRTTNFTVWLDAAEKNQTEASQFEAPVLTSEGIARKLAPIENSFKRLAKTPKPKPPPKPLNGTKYGNSTRGSRNRTRSNKTATPDDETDTPTPEPSPDTPIDEEAADEAAADAEEAGDAEGAGDAEEAGDEKVKEEL